MNDLRQLLSRAVRGETVGPYRIRLVSAEQVRNLSPEGQEFGLGGVHDDLAMIPPNEIWISDLVEPEERRFIIDGLVARLRTGSADRGTAVEAFEREKASGYEAREWGAVPIGTRTKFYGDVTSDHGDRFRVWGVDGPTVRNHFQTTFVEGANPACCPYVPGGEIWIEDTVSVAERPLIVLHEVTEEPLMTYSHMTYPEAHWRAAAVEWAERSKRR